MEEERESGELDGIQFTYELTTPLTASLGQKQKGQLYMATSIHCDL